MQAIEFVSKAHDDVVDLPREYQGWNGKQVRVILLEAETGVAKRKALFSAASISTRGYRFNRDEANTRYATCQPSASSSGSSSRCSGASMCRLTFRHVW